MASITAPQFLIAAATASAAGTAISTYGAFQQAKAQQDAANINAKVASDRARIAYDQSQRTKRRNLGTLRARQGASGVLVDENSSLDVLSDLAMGLEEQALINRYKGTIDANNARNRASAYGSQATSSLILGGASTATGLLSAGYLYKTNFAGGSSLGGGGADSFTSASQRSFTSQQGPNAMHVPSGAFGA